MKNNPYASVVSEVANSDANLTADASIKNEEDEDMIISDKGDQKNV